VLDLGTKRNSSPDVTAIGYPPACLKWRRQAKFAYKERNRPKRDLRPCLLEGLR
jgi:hypothetical protein